MITAAETTNNKSESNSGGAQNPPNSAAGTQNKPAWASQLVGDLQGNDVLTQFATISDLGKAHLDLVGKTKNSVTLPGEGATEKELGDFYARLGRPESPDKYDLPRPKLPEGMSYDEGAEKSFRAMAHKLGLTSAQFKSMYDEYNRYQVAAFAAQSDANKKAVEAANASLKKDWGDQYDANMELTKRAIYWLGGDDLVQELGDFKIGNSPAMAKAFAKIGKLMADDSFHAGSGSGTPRSASSGVLNYPSMQKQKK
jgi:hypothetical protein